MAEKGAPKTVKLVAPGARSAAKTRTLLHQTPSAYTGIALAPRCLREAASCCRLRPPPRARAASAVGLMLHSSPTAKQQPAVSARTHAATTTRNGPTAGAPAAATLPATSQSLSRHCHQRMTSPTPANVTLIAIRRHARTRAQRRQLALLLLSSSLLLLAPPPTLLRKLSSLPTGARTHPSTR